jgi:hypothetical protein
MPAGVPMMPVIADDVSIVFRKRENLLGPRCLIIGIIGK